MALNLVPEIRINFQRLCPFMKDPCPLENDNTRDASASPSVGIIDVVNRSAEKDQNDRVSSQKPVRLISSSPFREDERQCFRPGVMYTDILLMNLSLLMGRPFFPLESFGVSVHISLTFSSTMLQCRSNAFTLARSLRLFRIEIRTWVWLRTAVWRIERGPALNSCSSNCEISYSLCIWSVILVFATRLDGNGEGHT